MSNIILTTMCAIIDKENKRALFINREKSWKGITFPGGHLEPNESVTDCIVREVKEETNLDISNIQFKGITNFYNKEIEERYMVFNFIADTYSGELCKNNEEGTLFWVNYNEISNLNFAEGMEMRLELFFGDEISEMFVEWNKKDGYIRTIRHVL